MAVAEGDAVEEAAAVIGVVLVLPLVAADFSLPLSAAVMPFVAGVCEAVAVSGLRPPLPHTEAGGV